MSRILVVDQHRRPLMPTTPARARILLKRGKATILRRFPVVLILQAVRPDAVVEPLRAKLDPGSKTSGMAVVHDQTGEVVWAAELTHRSEQIRGALSRRRTGRRARRSRHTRYRAPRYANRRRPVGWLAPSLLSRVVHLLTWVKRLRQWCPIGAISQELVRFDPQAFRTQRSKASTISEEPYLKRRSKSISWSSGNSNAPTVLPARPGSKSTMSTRVRVGGRTACPIW